MTERLIEPSCLWSVAHRDSKTGQHLRALYGHELGPSLSSTRPPSSFPFRAHPFADPPFWPTGVSDIAFSSDSRFIASGSNDHSVRLWSVELVSPQFGAELASDPTGRAHFPRCSTTPVQGTPVHEPMLAHQGPVLCLAFNPQGNRLASGGKDECVWLWDVRKGQSTLGLHLHHQRVPRPPAD